MKHITIADVRAALDSLDERKYPPLKEVKLTMEQFEVLLEEAAKQAPSDEREAWRCSSVNGTTFGGVPIRIVDDPSKATVR